MRTDAAPAQTVPPAAAPPVLPLSAAVAAGARPARGRARPRPRHFLDLSDFTGLELRGLLDRARALKANRLSGAPLSGRTLMMIFEKPSTRTRLSFELAMRQLGGLVITANHLDLQLGRGETIADTARVLSRYVDAIMLRTGDETKLRDLATHAEVPVINGLTDRSHPCQILADILTFEEHRGPITGRTIAWSGCVNNVTRSLVHAAARLAFRVRVASPPSLGPDAALRQWVAEAGADVTFTADADAAVRGADCVVTDTWVSMADQDDGGRHRLLEPFRIDERRMDLAAPDALFMHCLPAHRGEEVTDGVLDGPQSVVLDEAENRLHAQKAVLAWCLDADA